MIVLIKCVVVLRIKCELLSDPCHGSARLNCQRVNYDEWADPFYIVCDILFPLVMTLFINERFVTIYPTVYYIT